MPRKYLMNWEGEPAFRWYKMYRGTRYRVGCNTLAKDFPALYSDATEEKSYRAANAWWQMTVAGLTVLQLEEDQRERLQVLQARLEWARQNQPELVPVIEHQQHGVKLLGHDEELPPLDEDAIASTVESAKLFGVIIPDDLDVIAKEGLFGNNRVWRDRLSRHVQTPKEKTVETCLASFLAEIRNSQKSPTHNEILAYLNSTLTSPTWTKETSVETIDEQTVARHYNYLCSLLLSPGRHNKLLGFFRRFVEWLVSSRYLERLPLNIKLKQHRKKPTYQAVKQFANVKEVIEGLKMPYCLWALLGVNCGMTNADLGGLTWEMINRTTWVLTRRRAKTGDNPNSPTVSYKLWTETVAALKELGVKENGLVFMTSNGKPMYDVHYTENGKPSKKDMFANKWQRLKPACTIPLAKFRSIGSTYLKHDEQWRGYVDLFLAHTPKTLADINYSAESDPPFFRALAFIRSELGFK